MEGNAQRRFIVCWVTLCLLLIAGTAIGAEGERGPYTIQVGAFRHQDDAWSKAEALQKKGLDAFWRKARIAAKGEWYRVFLGRFQTKEEAETRARALKARGLISRFLIREETESSGSGEGEPGERKDSATEKGDEADGTLSPGPGRRAEKGGPPGQEEKGIPLVIKDIVIRPGEGGKEFVFIRGNRVFSPTVFPLADDRLRFVIDIKETDTFLNGPSRMIQGNRAIRRIRAYHHTDTKTLRIVLDLQAVRDYYINQIFYRAENVYVLEVASIEGIEGRAGEREGPETGQGIPSRFGTVERGEGFRFRTKGADITREDLGKMLVSNRFYSSCWDHNSDFCNPEGDFGNHFRDNGDDTVTDRSTWLMWQKSGSPHTMTWHEAGGYVTRLNTEKFAGYSDWRLPTTEEAGSLLERAWRGGGLFIDGLFDRRQKGCWSADTQGPLRVWEVNFRLGYITDSPKTYRNSVRAVRTVKTPARERTR